MALYFLAPTNALLLVNSVGGFHHLRLAKQAESHGLSVLPVKIREADTADLLWQAAQLRTASFYAYPPERAFAGKLHQKMKLEEEFDRLNRCHQLSQNGAHGSPQRACCLIAVAVEPAADTDKLDAEAEPSELEAVVGTTDLVMQSRLEGEVLRGFSKRPAYLAGLCVAPTARRRGVGGALIKHARRLACTPEWSADALFVHMMAANEAARAFYERQGFVLDQQESSNRAHYRGQCLDGISGGARTILLRDAVFREVAAELRNVGFLRYFQLKQVPNFLLANPMLVLAILAATAFAYQQPGLFFSLGLAAPHAVRARLSYVPLALNNRDIIGSQTCDATNLTNVGAHQQATISSYGTVTGPL